MLKQVFSQYIITFEQQNAIKDKLPVIKEKLHAFFEENAYTVIGLPDSIQIPPEAPRIFALSSERHSHLEISLTQIKLVTKFDEKYAQDFAECFDYLEKRIQALNSVTREITDDEIIFNGIVTQFVDDEQKQAKEYILKKLYKPQINAKKIFDVMSKLTYKKDDIYYINASMNNIRQDEKNEIFGLELDINSRYFSNYKNYKYADEKIIDGTVQLYQDIVTNHLSEIIAGEFSI